MLALVAPFCAAFILSALFCGLIVWFGPRDAPDGGRKMQKRAVPTSGGAGILLASLLSLAGLALSLKVAPSAAFSHLSASGWLPHFVLIGSAAAVGFVDDVAHLGARLKMALLAGFSLYAAGFGFHATPFSEASSSQASFFFLVMSVGGSALWLFVIMNALNFMDGCNALAGGVVLMMSAALSATSLYWSAATGGATLELIFALSALIGAVLGFLVWNAEGRLYMGDAGALGLGAVFGSATLFLDHSAYEVLSDADDRRFIWMAAIVALPLLIDVFMTLLWRARRGENILNAHREHAYQLFMRAGWPHLGVAGLWTFFAFYCGVAGFFVAVAPDTVGGAEGFSAALVLGVALWLIQRRIYWPKVRRIEAEAALNTPG